MAQIVGWIMAVTGIIALVFVPYLVTLGLDEWRRALLIGLAALTITVIILAWITGTTMLICGTTELSDPCVR